MPNQQDSFSLPQPQEGAAVSSQPLSSSGTPPVQTGNSGNPHTADDNDLIEKDWINKIKQTLAQTKGDPYEQSRAITSLRADYLQKRYNKTLKMSDT
jgi:hypothetical protein